MLLVSTGLLPRSLCAVEQVRPSLDQSNVSTAYVINDAEWHGEGYLVSPGYFETLRMALGARPAQIQAEFLKHGVLAGAAGLLVGLAASVYAQRWFTGMLFEIKPFDACC